MANRPRSLALGVSLLVILGCSSHQQALVPAGNSASQGRGMAVASHVGGVGEPSIQIEKAGMQPHALAEGVTGPIAVQAVGFGESPAARDLPPAAAETDRPDGGEAREGPENRAVRRAIPSLGRTAEVVKRDGALQSAIGPLLIPTPAVSFEGISNSDNAVINGFRVTPPDTDGDVGPNQYVQIVNDLFRVYDKTGVPQTAPLKLSGLWAAAGNTGLCATHDDGDPIALYDPLADRWLLSQFAFAGLSAPPYHECVAISKTSDPAGAYFLYDFVTAGNEFPDYPKLGVWPDGYYMMVHQFTLGGPFNGTGAYSFDRKKMLAGDPTAGYIYFNLNLASHPEAIGGSLPSDVDGLNPPPFGRPNTYAYFTSTHFGDPKDGIRLFDFHVDFAIPANSTFTERPETTYALPLPVPAFDPTTPPGNFGRRAVRQPQVGTVTAQNNSAVDAITDRFMHRMAYRNFGGHESLVLTHTVGVGTGTTITTFRAGVRYYELRSNGSGPFFVNEKATFSPADDIYRWMPSAAMDHEGNLAVGYSVSNPAISTSPSAVFPGVRYAGRLASDPADGLFQGENTLINGTGVQTDTGNNRWGDYSALNVDPVDDCTFWYTQMYYTAASQATSTVGWLTRIGSFKVNPACSAPPQGTLSGTITFCDTGAPAAGALVEISDGHTAPVTSAGTYSIKLSPGTYTIHVTGPSCTPTSPTTVSITDGGTATYSTCLSGTPNLVFKSVSVTGGNGDGIIQRDECNELFITLNNVGCAKATGVSAYLISSTPGVTVDPLFQPYPDIPEGGAGTNTVAYEVSTSPTFVCGTPINFELTVATFTPFVIPFTLPTCAAPPTTFTGNIALTDPTQNTRIFRDGVASSCGAPKAACPGTTGAGTRHYDSYSVTNGAAAPVCVKVDISGPCSPGSGLNVYSAAYLGLFNPANICQNYLADEGASSAGTGSYFFNLPAGQTAVVVVNEVTQNQGCSSYTLTLSGLLDNSSGGGQCLTLTELSPAKAWLGLKNSDDVGTRFDLKAEVLKNGTVIGSGEVDNVPGGGSGFNNAILRAVNLGLPSPALFLPGETLSIRLSVRIGATGHGSGTARLWYNDAAANSSFDVTINGVNSVYYLRDGFVLGTSPAPVTGTSKRTIDVLVNRAAGNPFKPFGTWSKTF